MAALCVCLCVCLWCCVCVCVCPVLMKDRCKLFCRVAGSTAYYQLRDRVIDGTPCGPDTNDICVQGLCREIGRASCRERVSSPV